jgi:hypothetical protein
MPGGNDASQTPHGNLALASVVRASRDWSDRPEGKEKARQTCAKERFRVIGLVRLSSKRGATLEAALLKSEVTAGAIGCCSEAVWNDFPESK